MLSCAQSDCAQRNDGWADADRSNPPYRRQRPYCVEYTRSHPNSEAKQRKARSVLGWGTAWEVLRVLLAFCARVFLHWHKRLMPMDKKEDAADHL